MDNLRKEQVNTFIANANKSSQAPLINYDVFSGKRVRPGDELNITLKGTGGWCLFFAVIGALAFIAHISLGG